MMATEAGGTHSTGMISCLEVNLKNSIHVLSGLFSQVDSQNCFSENQDNPGRKTLNPTSNK